MDELVKENLPAIIPRYTLDEIKTVLGKILEEPELRLVMNDFERFIGMTPSYKFKAPETKKKPKNWYIIITEDNIADVKEWRDANRAYTIGAAYGVVNGVRKESSDFKRFLNEAPDAVELTYEEFLKWYLPHKFDDIPF